MVVLLASTKQILYCTVYCISLKAISSPLIEIFFGKKYAKNVEMD
jgi:hypothetical protein